MVNVTVKQVLHGFADWLSDKGDEVGDIILEAVMGGHSETLDTQSAIQLLNDVSDEFSNYLALALITLKEVLPSVVTDEQVVVQLNNDTTYYGGDVSDGVQLEL